MVGYDWGVNRKFSPKPPFFVKQSSFTGKVYGKANLPKRPYDKRNARLGVQKKKKSVRKLGRKKKTKMLLSARKVFGNAEQDKITDLNSLQSMLYQSIS